MTEAKREKQNYRMAHYHCRDEHEYFMKVSVRYGDEGPDFLSHYETQGREAFAKAAAALGYRLVALEPAPVTSEPGFDGRDGGRMHETSSAQEGV